MNIGYRRENTTCWTCKETYTYNGLRPTLDFDCPSCRDKKKEANIQKQLRPLDEEIIRLCAEKSLSYRDLEYQTIRDYVIEQMGPIRFKQAVLDKAVNNNNK